MNSIAVETKEETKGSALDTGQIEQVVEENILPASVDNNGTNSFSKTLCFICAAHVMLKLLL
jgi:hypothetical protein